MVSVSVGNPLPTGIGSGSYHREQGCSNLPAMMLPTIEDMAPTNGNVMPPSAPTSTLMPSKPKQPTPATGCPTASSSPAAPAAPTKKILKAIAKCEPTPPSAARMPSPIAATEAPTADELEPDVVSDVHYEDWLERVLGPDCEDELEPDVVPEEDLDTEPPAQRRRTDT
jgi:hypothetical protein